MGAAKNPALTVPVFCYSELGYTRLWFVDAREVQLRHVDSACAAEACGPARAAESRGQRVQLASPNSVHIGINPLCLL